MVRERCIAPSNWHRDVFYEQNEPSYDTRRWKSPCATSLIIKGCENLTFSPSPAPLYPILPHFSSSFCVHGYTIYDPLFLLLFFIVFSLSLLISLSLFLARLLHLSKENMMNARQLRYWTTIGDDKSLRCFTKRKIGPLFARCVFFCRSGFCPLTLSHLGKARGGVELK